MIPSVLAICIGGGTRAGEAAGKPAPAPEDKPSSYTCIAHLRESMDGPIVVQRTTMGSLDLEPRLHGVRRICEDQTN